MQSSLAETTYRLQRTWRVLPWVVYPAIGGLVLFAMALPRLIPGSGSIYMGFAIAALFGSALVVSLANPPASRIERSGEGLTVRGVLGNTRFVAWKGITGVRDRPLLGQVELLVVDGPPIRLPRHLEGLPDLVTEALQGVAPPLPHDFPASPWSRAMSVLGLASVPVSVVMFDGVLMAAWAAAAAGAVGLAYVLRGVRLTPSLLVFRRPLARKILPLGSIVATHLEFSGMASESTVVALLTRQGEVVRVSLPSGRILLFHVALERQLRKVHGDAWGAVDEPTEGVDDDALVRSALADFEASMREPRA